MVTCGRAGILLGHTRDMIVGRQQSPNDARAELEVRLLSFPLDSGTVPELVSG